MNLQKGTTLQNGRYRIDGVLGQGGFGITYLGYHVELECKVAVKEFFMTDFCNRESDGKNVTVATLGKKELVDKLREKFKKEARSIAKLQMKLHHSGIVGVSDVFEENGTAYYVMEYVDGKSLGKTITSGNPLSEAVALGYIRKLCDALALVHTNNIMHLDIKPDNVMVGSDGRVVLIDFGASKQYDEGSGENTSTLLGYTRGYAPPEQMNLNVVKFLPATDIYSLGATFYKLLTGVTPIDATLRASGEEIPPLPSSVILPVRRAIEAAMQLNKLNRPQSIADFIALLDASSPAVGENCEVAVSVVKVDESTVFPGDEDESDKKSKVVSVAADTSGNKTFVVGGVKFKMIAVNGGIFRMGRNSFLSLSDEFPAYDVTLSDYYIGETEVTQELWQAVMGSNPSRFTGNLQRPVERVSWNDCQTFIRKLNELTGGNFRLPTEAEWEYAARGGQKSRGYKYSGSDNIGEVAWYGGNSDKTTHAVKTKSPNELGIYDMSGNVWEWCQDWYGDYSSAAQTNPKGASSGSNRVNRGGSWSYGAIGCRCTYRSNYAPTFTSLSLGLRLVSQ